MSAAAGLAARSTTARATGRDRSQPLRRPSLELVPAGRSRAGRTPFVAVVVSLLAAGLLGLLVLNTVLAQDAFRLHTLKEQSRALEDVEQALQREVEALRAPQALAARAGALGMVQAGPPAFLRLPDGAVLGAETPAEDPTQVPELGAARAPVAPAAEAQTGTDETAPVEDDR